MNSPPDPSAGSPPTPGEAREKLRVLIAEDDSTSRLLLRGILERMGDLEIIEAEDGLQAWSILDRGFLPGVCFLDINMPRLNGVELLRRMRGDKRFAAIKACFCSAVRDRQVIVQAAALQPDQYILKPYTPSAIEAQIQKARESLHQTQSLDSMDAVCARLGIDQATYLRILDRLLAELRNAVTQIPTLLTRLDVAGATAALDGARSAAQLLGARPILKLADALTRLLRSSASGAGQEERSKEGMAAQLPQWLACSTDDFFQILQDVRGELHTIERIAAVAKTQAASQTRPENSQQAGAASPTAG